VSGVPPEADQEEEKYGFEPETCCSEAEIPPAAKRQRGTLKPETSVAKPLKFDLPERTRLLG
jgi:hypothetical protein